MNTHRSWYRYMSLDIRNSSGCMLISFFVTFRIFSRWTVKYRLFFYPKTTSMKSIFQQVSDPVCLNFVFFVSDGCCVRITPNPWRASWVVFCKESFWKPRSTAARVTPTWWRSSSGSRVSGSISTASWRHTAPLTSPSVSSDRQTVYCV